MRKFFFDDFRELKRIPCLSLVFESLKFVEIGPFGFEKPLIRGLGGVVFFSDFGADSYLFDELDRRLEIVLEDP